MHCNAGNVCVIRKINTVVSLFYMHFTTSQTSPISNNHRHVTVSRILRILKKEKRLGHKSNDAIIPFRLVFSNRWNLVRWMETKKNMKKCIWKNFPLFDLFLIKSVSNEDLCASELELWLESGAYKSCHRNPP